MYRVYATRSHGSHQSWNSPPSRAVAWQQPPQNRIAQHSAVLHAGHADDLLRRRNRHGRQFLSRRSQRLPHADAVEPRPQRRIFKSKSAAALSADHDRPRVSLRSGQRGKPAEESLVVTLVDAARDRHAEKFQGVFARLALNFSIPDNPKVLAFLRQYEDETILVVVNLSRFAQSAELDLSRFAGCVPMEVFSRISFRPIRKSRYVITLGPHAHYWFALHAPTDGRRILRKKAVPIIGAPIELEKLLDNGQRAAIEGEILPRYLQTCRWFGSKARTFRHLKVVEQPAISSGRRWRAPLVRRSQLFRMDQRKLMRCRSRSLLETLRAQFLKPRRTRSLPVLKALKRIFCLMPSGTPGVAHNSLLRSFVARK